MTLAIYRALAPQVGALMPEEPAKTGLMEGVRAGCMALIATAQRRLALRRARRELLAMPDATLKDFGIYRSEIEWTIRYGREDGTHRWRNRGREPR